MVITATAPSRKISARKSISTVGERLRNAREEKEMSQLDVSNLLGLSRAAVAQWESNTTSPSLFKVMEVAKILGVSPEWLAFGIAAEGSAADAPEIVKVPEIVFDDSETPNFIPMAWLMPRDWVRGDLKVQTPDKIAVWRVDGSGMAPAYEEGDRVVVDLSVKRPSPGGVFLHWDGVGPVLNTIVIRPIDGKPKAIVSSSDPSVPSFESNIEDLRIVGRVRGVLKAL